MLPFTFLDCDVGLDPHLPRASGLHGVTQNSFLQHTPAGPAHRGCHAPEFPILHSRPLSPACGCPPQLCVGRTAIN